MYEPKSAVVDARGNERVEIREAPGLPPVPGLPDREPIPRLLASEPAAPLLVRRPSKRSRRSWPVATLPAVAEGSRTETRTLDIYAVIDKSPSNAWTDPDDARHQDLAYLARKWASQVIPIDNFIPVVFDRTAVVYAGCRPRQVPRDGWRNLPAPNPVLGGTCFLPPADAVVQHAARLPAHAALAIFLSDGMPSNENDIAQASAALTAADIPAVLIPYGCEFPWISAHWEHSAFRIAAHVQDRRRAIAQTVALAIIGVTGHRRVVELQPDAANTGADAPGSRQRLRSAATV
jgi:hypothetical protein